MALPAAGEPHHLRCRGPFGHEEWSAGLESAVVVHGTLDRWTDPRASKAYVEGGLALGVGALAICASLLP